MISSAYGAIERLHVPLPQVVGQPAKRDILLGGTGGYKDGPLATAEAGAIYGLLIFSETFPANAMSSGGTAAGSASIAPVQPRQGMFSGLLRRGCILFGGRAGGGTIRCIDVYARTVGTVAGAEGAKRRSAGSAPLDALAMQFGGIRSLCFDPLTPSDAVPESLVLVLSECGLYRYDICAQTVAVITLRFDARDDPTDTDKAKRKAMDHRVLYRMAGIGSGSPWLIAAADRIYAPPLLYAVHSGTGECRRVPIPPFTPRAHPVLAEPDLQPMHVSVYSLPVASNVQSLAAYRQSVPSTSAGVLPPYVGGVFVGTENNTRASALWHFALPTDVLGPNKHHK